MPGLVGLITGMPRGCAEPQLLRMLESIRPEPFYVSGTWMDESLGVYVGCVPLLLAESDVRAKEAQAPPYNLSIGA
jgi:hypothetical protein